MKRIKNYELYIRNNGIFKEVIVMADEWIAGEWNYTEIIHNDRMYMYSDQELKNEIRHRLGIKRFSKVRDFR